MRLDLIARFADRVCVRADKANTRIDRFISGAFHKERLCITLNEQTGTLSRKIPVDIFTCYNSRRNLNDRTLTDIFIEVNVLDCLAAVKEMTGRIGMRCRMNTRINRRKVALVALFNGTDGIKPCFGVARVFNCGQKRF